MGLSFRKSVKLGGGTRLNISKSGIGISSGIKGLRVGVGPKGLRTTASIPGTGIRYTKQKSLKSPSRVDYGPVNSNQGYIPAYLIIPKVPFKYFALTLILFPLILIGCFAPPFLLVTLAVAIADIIVCNTKGYKILMNTQKAIKAFESSNNPKCYKYAGKVLQYDPDNYTAEAFMAMKYSDELNSEMVIKIMTLLPPAYLDLSMQYRLAAAYCDTKQYKPAIPLFQQIIKESDGDLFSYELLAESFFNIGETSLALDTCTEALKHRKKKSEKESYRYELRYTKAQCYIKMGMEKDALKELNVIYSHDIGFKDVGQLREKLLNKKGQ